MTYKLLCFLKKRQNLILHLVSILLIVCGFTYSYLLGNELRFPDEKAYYTYATNLTQGLGYTLDGEHPSSWRTPGYPVFLSIFVYFGAKPVFLRGLNFIALSGCLYLISSILKRSGAVTGAGLSAILILGYGVLFYTAGTLYPQTLFSLFLLLLVRIAICPQFSYFHALFFGIVGAILIMLHPTAVFIPPLIIVCLILPNNWNIIPRGIVSGIVIILCFAPWVYRNYLIYDAFIPISAHGGDTLYWGNNPNTDVDAWFQSITDDITEQTKGMTELEEDRYYKKLAFEFWKNQPGAATKLYFKKFLYHFNFQNTLKIESESHSVKDIIMFITYYPLLLCLILRLLFIKKIPLGRTEYLLICIYFVSALFHAIFLTRIRFRLPYDILLITHIGIMFSLLINWLESKKELT